MKILIIFVGGDNSKFETDSSNTKKIIQVKKQNTHTYENAYTPSSHTKFQIKLFTASKSRQIKDGQTASPSTRRFLPQKVVVVNPLSIVSCFNTLPPLVGFIFKREQSMAMSWSSLVCFSTL